MHVHIGWSWFCERVYLVTLAAMVSSYVCMYIYGCLWFYKLLISMSIAIYFDSVPYILIQVPTYIHVCFISCFAFMPYMCVPWHAPVSYIHAYMCIDMSVLIDVPPISTYLLIYTPLCSHMSLSPHICPTCIYVSAPTSMPLYFYYYYYYYYICVYTYIFVRICIRMLSDASLIPYI